LLVKPTCNVGTQEAFSGIKPNESGERIADYISKPFNEMKKVLVNDFEETVFKLYPEISQLKKQIENAGAIYTSMSGSGSSVFGIFESEPGEIHFEKEYTVFKTKLL
jgi:4-diphosphocytidyl-2-C-methyl-D-erythritol kinase